MIPIAAKNFAKRSARRIPALQHALDSYRRRRRLRDLDMFLRIGRFLDVEHRAAFIADIARICLDTQLGPAGLLNLEFLAHRMIVLGQAGAFVECGTWQGGAIAFFALSYRRQGGVSERCHLYGFDSFQGMPRMTAVDGKTTSRWLYGRELDSLEPHLLRGGLIGSEVNRASAEDCRNALRRTGYPENCITVVEGWFQDVLPIWRGRIGPIAVLRIDGDLYESTRICFEMLYDLVITGGIVIVDDYGTFEGCRRATDEFLAGRPPVELIPVDVGVVYFVKAQ